MWNTCPALLALTLGICIKKPNIAPAVNSAKLKYSIYCVKGVYDLELEVNSTGVTTRLLEGKFKVKPEVYS